MEPQSRPERGDPLVERGRQPDRLNYATGMLLGADDFSQEQAYHRGRLARALAYLHGSGTAAGLRAVPHPRVEPNTDPDLPRGREEELAVQPGLAVDRLGRLIELHAEFCIRLQRWYDQQPTDALVEALHPRRAPRVPVADDPYSGVVADLFIRFRTCTHELTQAFASGPFDALNAVVPARLRDHFLIELILRPEDEPPLPARRWPGRSDSASIAPLHERILDAWQESLDRWERGAPKRLPEQPPGLDTTALFLARVVLPITAATVAAGRPERDLNVAVTVDNSPRGFVYTTGALAAWLELEGGEV